MKRNLGSTMAFLRNWGTLLAAALFVAPMTGALADPGGTDRPHLGKCDTAFGPLPPTFPAVAEISASCHFRHLGLTTGMIVQTIDAAGPPSNGVLPLTITDGRIAYVAANGDELHATIEGTASFNLATGAIAFETIETIVGGTGRFSNASGESFIEGHASAVTLTGFYVSVGTLSY
jgi:hypothetical protein